MELKLKDYFYKTNQNNVIGVYSGIEFTFTEGSKLEITALHHLSPVYQSEIINDKNPNVEPLGWACVLTQPNGDLTWDY